jgi:hypothetical protein
MSRKTRLFRQLIQAEETLIHPGVCDGFLILAGLCPL